MSPMNQFASRFSGAAAALAAAWMFLQTGCGHPTAMITATTAPPVIASADPAHPTNVPGIPFYAKRGMCKRETVWAEPKFTLEVDQLVGGKPVVTRTIVMPRSYLLTNQDPAQPLGILIKELNVLASARKKEDLGVQGAQGSVCPADVSAQWSAVESAVQLTRKPAFCEEANVPGCELIGAAEENGDLLRSVNSAAVVAEVDYEHVYYMNTRTPWIGNASVDAKLQADGTLNEGNLQANDQTWSTILQTIGGLASNVATVEAAKYGAAATAASTTMTTTTAPPSTGAVPAPALDAHVAPPPPPPPCEIPGWPFPSADTTTTTTTPGVAKPDPKTPPEKPTGTTTKDASISYRVSLTPTVYLHDHVKKDLCIGPDPNCGTGRSDNCSLDDRDCWNAKQAASTSRCIPAPLGILGGSFTITKVDDSKSKDDPNTIKVSGQVVLPKADAADKGPK